MRTLGTGLARFCLAAWCGGAGLFVTVAIRPIRLPIFDSEQRAQLASLLFPGYYTLGMVLLSVALVGTLLGTWTGRARITLVLLTLCALLCLVGDYIVIYSPLAEATRKVWQEHAAPEASFRNQHIASMVANGVMLAFSLLAAGCASAWPAAK